jgi:hypothetical protein
VRARLEVLNDPGSPRENAQKPRALSGLFIVLVSFSFFMAVASLVGSFLPALLVGDCWNYHKRPANWHGFGAVLVNGSIAGLALGVCTGLLCTLLCTALQGSAARRSSADRALDLLGASLFVLGAINGVFFAALTASRFHQEWIWNWRGPS